jgi:hypothetical protein
MHANWDDVTTNLYRNMLLDIPNLKPAPLFLRLYSRGVQSSEYQRVVPCILKKLNTRWRSNILGQPLDTVESYISGT